MLFRKEVWDRLADGSVTVAFRRWKRPTVSAGGTLRSPGGLLSIDQIDVVDIDAITDNDAVAAGHQNAAAVQEALGPDDGRLVHRIVFHLVGPDPRTVLRERDNLTPAEVKALVARLDRLDSFSRDFPWTWPVLELIAEAPGLRAADMADRLGCERDWLKRKVTKLKELGLTISLSPGYELSPRGRALLAAR